LLGGGGGVGWTEAVGTKQHQTQGTKRNVPSSVWVQQNKTQQLGPLKNLF